jgi:hypothetical protein
MAEIEELEARINSLEATLEAELASITERLDALQAGIAGRRAPPGEGAPSVAAQQAAQQAAEALSQKAKR